MAERTNFPRRGDNKKVSLRNSNYPQFDYAYADDLRRNWPGIWRRGGNIRGNGAFRNWTAARGGSETAAVLSWIREREAWAARHFRNSRLAGVVAQIKWGVIGSRGEGYMKELVNGQKERERQRQNSALAPVVYEEIFSYTGTPCERCQRYIGTIHRQGEGPEPPFHHWCQCGRRTVAIESENGVLSVDLSIQSEPIAGVLAVNGRPVDDNYRRELRQRLEAGELDAIEFDASVFRAAYPNANRYRFRDVDLSAFAASYAGQPFLRDHNTGNIEARDGTIVGAELVGNEFVQRIRLTTERGMKSFIEGQIDRFSIGWFFEGVTCSVCNQNFYQCSHWPGMRYTVKDANGNESEVLAELIFEKPTGKETSAVNAPAVSGTRVLASLCEMKKSYQKETIEMEDELELKLEAQEESAVTETAPIRLVKEGEGAALHVDVWGAYLRTQAIETALLASRLPAAAQDAVRQFLNGRANVTPRDVDAAIAAQRAVLAEAAEKSTVRGVNPLDSQVGSLEKVEIALDALLMGGRPAKGVRPLTGIREAYILLSGDYDMHGMFVADNVGLANVTTSTMAGLVANAMNKRVVNEFQQYPRWWEPIVFEEDFESLNTVRWITLGGVGELPTVSEGAAYSELVWDDQTETSVWAKKGGYLGLTLEMIDRDDTQRFRRAPRALAQAAWLTLSKSCSAIFTQSSGVGPTMSDSNALFHASHSNLGTTALSFSAWEATRTAMRKQTELNSAERLGALTAPKFLLVPSDLETTAIQILASMGEPGTPNNDENPYAEGDGHDARMGAARQRVITVDLWTDTNNWAAVADPMMYPSIGLGYRYGRMPEVFSVASATNGLMFSNDVMPIKVRFFFAVGPTDWRGLYKHNVS